LFAQILAIDHKNLQRIWRKSALKDAAEIIEDENKLSTDSEGDVNQSMKMKQRWIQVIKRQLEKSTRKEVRGEERGSENQNPEG